MPPGIESFAAPLEPHLLSQAANPAPESERVLHPQYASANLDASPPNSQDTHVASSSKASGHPQLASDSSSLSSSSQDTSSTSPISLKAHPVQKVASLQPPPSQIVRPVTPEVRNAIRDSSSERVSSVSTSPVSVGSQSLKQGSKRTASGAVKPPTVDNKSAVDYSGHLPQKQDADRPRSSSRAAEVGTRIPFFSSLA